MIPILGLSGCVTMKVDPIHITMDINVRVTEEVQNVFGEIDNASTALIDDTLLP